MTRLSRRALLAGALSAGGAAAAAAVVVRRAPGPSDEPSLPAGEPSPSPPPTPTPLPRGGAARLAATSSFDFDTFDALRSGEPSTVELLGRVHARLLQWDDPAGARLGPDLAAAREQPDPLTLLLRLDARARWQDVPPLGGRPVTGDDVRFHLERALAIAREGTAPLVQRTGPLREVARVELPAPGLIRLVLARPSPLLEAALAAEFALVQPPEVASRFDADPLDPALLAGCGPWRFAGFDRETARLEAYTAGHRVPLLDALSVSPPTDTLARYRAGDLDEFPALDPRDAAAARSLPGIQEFALPWRETVLSTFSVSAPPWSDARLLEALSGALNRGWLAEALFAGRARPAGPLPPVSGAALPESDLAAFPGYAADPDADAGAARQRWEAAGGPALGTVAVDIPAIFDPRYAASAVVIERLNAILGPQFRPAVERYPVIAARVQEGFYGNGRAAFWFGWGPPLPSPDPREALLELFGHALAPADRDALFSSADAASLRGLQRRLLAGFAGGVVPWVQQLTEVFRRPGLEGPAPSPFWDGHRDIRRYRSS
ncbi:ABC transporter substrate-binding protein [Tepidiforma flava]|uniref:ABC transporter substrate-binding protein n=1 Tax=Tepidiforma flava TaxID=3004094 RepID=A0ABY7M425_9CHLR|nr:ABC transporter substrate-binding protein [Tepidiforma flava]WBL35315.1 ABC transporter substrate-binding protein [Tepidiforma flava]